MDLKQYFLSLQNLFLGSVALLVGLLGAAFLTIRMQIALPSDPANPDTFFPPLMVLAFLSVAVGTFFFRHRMLFHNRQATLTEKLKLYFNAYLSRLLILSIPNALIVLSYFFLARDYRLLLLALLLTVLFLITIPSRYKVVSDLRLNKEEIDQLFRHDGKI